MLQPSVVVDRQPATTLVQRQNSQPFGDSKPQVTNLPVIGVLHFVGGLPVQNDVGLLGRSPQRYWAMRSHGLVRRELKLAQALLLEVTHGSVVTLRFAMPETQAAALMARLSESGRGLLVWLDGDASD